MKKRRTRRFIRCAKWAGLTLLVGSLALHLASAAMSATFIRSPWDIELVPGAILVLYGDLTSTDTGPLVRWESTRFPPLRWFSCGKYSANPQYWLLEIPLWFIALMSAIPTPMLWWADRRRFPPGHCSKCGYDLSATPAASGCPECGAGAGGDQPRSG